MMRVEEQRGKTTIFQLFWVLNTAIYLTIEGHVLGKKASTHKIVFACGGERDWIRSPNGSGASCGNGVTAAEMLDPWTFHSYSHSSLEGLGGEPEDRHEPEPDSRAGMKAGLG